MRKLSSIGKFVINRKNSKYNSIKAKIIYDKESPEAMLSALITANYNSELNRLSKTNLIFDILMKIKAFKEFVLTNDFDKDVILKLLNEGMLKPFKFEEKIYKKGTPPQFYFLVLVGVVIIYNNTQILPGNFFGDEILKGFSYKNTAIAGEDNTFLLIIHKDLFSSTLENKLKEMNEKIKILITNSFHIFKTFSNRNLEKYKRKIVKLFPKTGDTIISNKEKATAIYIIFKGICTLNTEAKKNLIILDEGDIFGIESLNNISNDMKILDGKYLYNIINKSPNTIIFKFNITDFERLIIISLKNQLKSYFSETKNIIEKHENMKEDLENKLIDKYRLFKMKKNIKDLFNKSVYKEFVPEKAEKFYNIAVNQIKSNQKYINDKQKLIPKIKYLSNRSVDNFTNSDKLLRKMVKSRSSILPKQENINDNNSSRRSLKLNSTRKRNLKDNQKIAFNSDFTKFDYNKEEELKTIPDKYSLNYLNKNRKNEQIKKLTIPSKSLYSSDNTKNNSFFFTTIDEPKNKTKYLNNSLSALSIKNRSNNRQKKFLRRKLEEYKNKEETSKNMISSIRRDPISLRSKTSSIIDKKNLEFLGFPISETIDYFNYRELDQSIFANNRESNQSNLKKNNIRKLLFYETKKYNIPLFIFLNNPEEPKLNLPQLSKF